MYKKTLLCGALALTAITSLNVHPVLASQNAKGAITDTAITAKVKALYIKSPVVKSSKVAVTTNHHKVALAGMVNTNTQYERAITLAESVDGVRAVNADNLKVKSSSAPLTDAYTTAKVKGAFLKTKLFGSQDIEYWPVKVETKDRVVYLSGSVDTPSERTNLINLTQKVRGVKLVNSSITVNQ